MPGVTERKGGSCPGSLVTCGSITPAPESEQTHILMLFDSQLHLKEIPLSRLRASLQMYILATVLAGPTALL